MKLVVPKQHGAWAMLIVPYWLEAAASGISWMHIVVFLTWTAMYLSVYTGISAWKFKRHRRRRSLFASFSLYTGICAVLAIWTVILYPAILLVGLAISPLFLISIYYVKTKNERSLVNDLAAVCIFSIGGLAATIVGQGQIDRTALLIAFISVLFFMGAALHVKMMIRERQNTFFHYYSWLFHALAVVAFIIAGYPLVGVAFLPGLVRTIAAYRKPLKILQIGIIEIINALCFFAIMLLSVHIYF
ncbi:YwiC-like family protein [Sporolactobacillus vineae]|uniref:YwiC-like family protein n=1 Tax=Sporolactobacillus vineae TaxID=444463 RepID=UPI000287BD13|nr:YwiC-like family protein [Sporolactobacillus vineae]